MSDFEGLLDEVLGAVANPGEPAAMRERLLARVAEERSAAGMRLLGLPAFGRIPAGASWRERRGSAMGALLLHAAAVVAIAFLVRQQVRFAAPERTLAVTELNVPATPPVAPKTEVMGGGGGQSGPAPVTKGHLPKPAERQIVPPSAQAVEEPKLPVEATIVIQRSLAMASSSPDVGLPNSPVVGMSMGNGTGTGLGIGRGSGLGPGEGGNLGGGLYRVGGGVSAPVLVYEVQPEFSEEARKEKVSGNVLVTLWVDIEGRPSHVSVLRGVGMGLDERAVAAVKQYRFKPAMRGGKPVAVEMNVEVDFRIF